VAPNQYLGGQYVVNKTGGIATVDATIPVGTEYIHIGTQSAGFTSGRKEVLSITATQFTYAESAGVATGLVWVGEATGTPTSELVSATGTDGTFVINPTHFTVRSFESSLTSSVTKGSSYSVVSVASTAEFPDSEGYIVFGYGTELVTPPIPYVQKISTTNVLLRGWTADRDLPVGTSVTVVELAASSSIDSALWVTGSVLAMLSAKLNVEESVANSIDLQFNVIYPGDRGLGGEGTDHSDETDVWGPDTIEDPE
jgi:hypothetical protein